MNYVTTNIRLAEEDYLKLKDEAARKRKSLSAVIRERLGAGTVSRKKEEIEKIMREINVAGASFGNKLKKFDSVKALRQMRYEGKW